MRVRLLDRSATRGRGGLPSLHALGTIKAAERMIDVLSLRVIDKL